MTPAPRGPGRLATRLFEIALLAFPRHFRELYAEGLREAFRERHGSSTSRPISRVFSIGLSLADTVAVGLAERLDVIRAGFRISRPRFMQNWFHDLRIAGRGLVRSPIFSIQATLTLALGTVGIGAVYPLLHQVVLRPLPYEEPDRLLTVRSAFDEQLLGVTLPEFQHLAGQTSLFRQAAAVLPPEFDQSLVWTDRSPRERLHAVRATPGLMDLLGISLTGRGFDPAPTAGDEVVLRHGFWQTRFNGDPSVVGHTMSLNDRPHEIVGILPEEFEFPLELEPYDVWAVFRPDPALSASSDHRVFRFVGRLDQGATLEMARATVPDLLRNFHQREATGINVRRVEVRGLHQDLVGSVRTPLLLLSGAAALVLMVAGLNAALLISGRNLSRERELAVRVAIGAGQSRIARFLLTEAGILAVIGTVLGGLGSGFGLVWIISATGLDLARTTAAEGGSLLATTPALMAVLLVTMGVALVPALRASRPGALSNRSGATTRKIRRAINWVVGVEAALVFGLLVAAGLTLVSFEALTRVDPGFEPAGAVAIEVRLPDDRTEGDRTAAAFQTMEQHLAGMPGVRTAGAVTHLPLDENNWGGAFAIEGRSDPAPDALPGVDWEFASPGYFDAVGIPILEGRGFYSTDRMGTPLVAVINETLARRYWPNGGAVGARVNGNGFDGTWFTVVGVVGDVKQQGLDTDSRGYLYMASLQSAFWPERQIVVRTESADPIAMVPEIRQGLLGIEPDLTIGAVTQLDALVREASGPFRIRAALFGAFGLIAALLGMAGIYGVVSHGVQSRQQEMGIRLALGADGNRMLRMVLVDGLRPVILGMTGGVGLVWLVGRWLSTLVFGVEAGSPSVQAGIAVVLLLSAVGAVLPSALRIRRLDPMRVLRPE